MTDYCTVTQVKTLGGISKSTDDDLLADLVTRASAMIDAYTRRRFAARTETRYYTPTVDVSGQTLYLDDDLLSITTLTNYDSEVPAEGFSLLPLNLTPKNRVKLKSDYSWSYAAEDAEGSISILGTWGYSATAPDDIEQAACRLALWLYKQREAPFNRTGNTLTGEYEVPTGMPADIKAILAGYRKPAMGAV